MAESPFSDNRMAPDVYARTTSLKHPPNSIDAEQSVLGAVLLDNAGLDKIAGILLEDDFYKTEHKIIFKAIQDLAADDKPFDLVTIAEELNITNKLAASGGIDYLGELVESLPSTANIQAYAGIIRERSIQRRLITASNTISENAFNPDGRDSTELLDLAEKAVLSITDERYGTGLGSHHTSSFQEATTAMMHLLNIRSQQKDGMIGVSTGLTDLDAKTAGMPKKELIIVAGRPSMGKTSLALNMAETAAMAGEPVVFFSLEMDKETLLMRSYSNLANIPFERILRGTLHDDEWQKLTQAIHKMKNLPLFVDETSDISPAFIRSRCRRIQNKLGRGLGMIVVDYLQLMNGTKKHGTREGEISEISRTLKHIAKEFDCPVVALSQLNRGLELRKNKRPVMSDLRESGAIEQDATIIMFVYRDEVYDENTRQKGVAEVIIGKNRNGITGTVYTMAELHYCRFKNLATTQMNFDESSPPGGFTWDDEHE